MIAQSLARRSRYLVAHDRAGVPRLNVSTTNLTYLALVLSLFLDAFWDSWNLANRPPTYQVRLGGKFA